MKRMKQTSTVTEPNASDRSADDRKECTFEDIHRMLFKGRPAKPITVEEMDEAIEESITEKYTHGGR